MNPVFDPSEITEKVNIYTDILQQSYSTHTATMSVVWYIRLGVFYKAGGTGIICG